jgi:hypothetical protein
MTTFVDYFVINILWCISEPILSSYLIENKIRAGIVNYISNSTNQTSYLCIKCSYPFFTNDNELPTLINTIFL